ncbi:MAG: outer membrane protein [Bacteroidia bacterium]|jgi:outer membrane protein
MRKFKFIAFFGMILAQPNVSVAQHMEAWDGPNQFTIHTCIQRVLSNNFDVALANMDSKIARNSVTKGNAGLLPNVAVNGGTNYSNNNTELKFAGGIPPTNVDGAVSSGYNASLGLNYTVFNGFANLNNFQKLKVSQNLSEAQLQLTIENAVITVIGLCLDYAKIEEDIVALRETISISLTRLNRAGIAQSNGSGSTIQLYSAKVDLNADSANLLNALNAKGSLQRQLNYLMGNQIDQIIELEADVDSFDKPYFDQILTVAKLNNSLLVFARVKENMTEVNQKLASANQYPTIALNTSYGLNASQSGAGIVLEQNNVGFSGGLTVSIPIFSGGRTKIAMDNAATQMQKSALEKTQNERLVEKEVYDYWSNYEVNEQLLKMELENLKTAELNVSRASELQRLGQITSVEFRLAQLNLLASKNRINAAKYNLKKSEYQLLRLKGELVK